MRLRWAGIVLIIAVGVLQLHLPHYLAETSAPASYATFPGPLLLATMIGSLGAAVGIARRGRWGWLLGDVVATLSCMLYVVQEMGGLPGLQQTWWEPTRILSLLLAGLFLILARQRVRFTSHDPGGERP
jgi:peptidoglycan/LPS O-acetylase OafA/YrhL